MTTLKGKAVIWGSELNSVATDAAGGTFILVGIITSYDWTSEASSKEILNAIGDCAALVFSNHKHTFNIGVTIFGDTLAACRANNTLPKPGDVTRFIDPNSGDIDGTFSGDYIINNATKNAEQESELKYTLNMVQYVANNLKNTVAA